MQPSRPAAAKAFSGVFSSLSRCSRVGLGAAALLLLAPCIARANMMDQIILSKCSSAMLEDFKKAGKTPPDGMVSDTCNCVVAQMKKRQSIEQAKTFCTEQSFQKYGKP